jgi:hypothetical protein
LRFAPIVLLAAGAFAQSRTVAIAVGDLPSAGDPKGASAEAVNAKLLAAFKRHHVPVTGFVIQKRVEEIVHGEATVAPLMKEAGKKPEFLRFPYNYTGDTGAKHDAIAAFLSGRGYKLATCTIDTSDYLFNDAYVLMLAKNDAASAQKLRLEYLR